MHIFVTFWLFFTLSPSPNLFIEKWGKKYVFVKKHDYLLGNLIKTKLNADNIKSL